jgi:hypothetical protein
MRLARHRLAVLTLAVLAVVSGFWSFLDVMRNANHTGGTFGVPAFEDRFSEIRKTVEPHQVFGYVSDNPDNSAVAEAEFRLTQYTLVPAIIKPTPQERRVIVNYHTKDLDPKLLQTNHLQPIQNFGNGVALTRGRRK